MKFAVVSMSTSHQGCVSLKRKLLIRTITFTLLFAIATFAAANPPLTPSSATTPVHGIVKFVAAKSSTNATGVWTTIQSRSDSAEKIDQDGTFHAGSTPGMVIVKAVSSDFAQPSYAAVAVTP
jgi:hypothetical protein